LLLLEGKMKIFKPRIRGEGGVYKRGGGISLLGGFTVREKLFLPRTLDGRGIEACKGK